MSRLRINFVENPICDLFESGYSAFQSSTGLNGLAKIENGTLSLLAVNATKERTGQFRQFIRQAKWKYKEIEVVEVWNEELRSALLRYGFVIDGDRFVWKKVD